MKFTCETCQLDMKTLAAWREHLPGEEHQNNSDRRMEAQIAANSSTNATIRLHVPSFLRWNNEENDRAVVVTGFKNITILPVDMLNHFGQFGFITDFIFNSRNQYSIILFDERASVEAVERTKWSNVLKGQWFRLRQKRQLSAIEWIILIELDGRYEKEDQEFFIRHAELITSISNQQISEQLHTFNLLSSLGPDELTARQVIMRDVTYIVKHSFQKVFVYPVQPLVHGLQDLDEVFEIYMDPFGTGGASMMPPKVPDYKLQEYQVAALRILYIIQNQTVIPGMEKYFSEVTVVPEDALLEQGERIISGIKFFHRSSGIRCKISFDAAMAANVSCLISFLLTLDIRILPFFRFLYYWSRIHRFVHRQPDIVPAITMLAIVYLVRRNIIPSVSVLQQLCRSFTNPDISAATVAAQQQQLGPYYVEGWDVSFIKDVGHVETHMLTRGKIPFVEETTSVHELFNPTFTLGKSGTRNLMVCLGEFFEAYAQSDWNKYVVSPFLGELLPRDMFELGQDGYIPAAMSLYKLRSMSHRLDVGQPIVVQHPFNLSCNLGAKMDGLFVAELKTAFLETSILIQKVLQSSDPKIFNLFPEIHNLLRRREIEPEFESSDSDNSHDSGLPTTEPLQAQASATRTLSYSSIVKKAALLPTPEVLSPKRSVKPSSGISSGRSTRDPNSAVVKVLKFEVNKRFREAFMTTCSGLLNENRLQDRLKTLAIVFMRDFVWSVWGRCFYLHTTSEKIPDTEQKFHEINQMFMEHFPACQLDKTPDSSDSSMSDIPDDASWQHELPENFEEIGRESEEIEEEQWRDLESDEDDTDSEPRPRIDVRHAVSIKSKRDPCSYGGKQYPATSKMSPPASVSVDPANLSEKEKIENITAKLEKIPKSACKNYCQIMRLHGYQKIWTNRRGVRSAFLLHEKLSKQLLLKESLGTTANEEGGSVSLTNPLDKEESVTRTVLEGVTGWGKTPSKRAIWSFSVIIRIDTTKDLPTLYMSIKEGRNPFVSQNMINYFSSTFPSIFSEYMAYRMNKWLDGYGKIKPHVPLTHK